MKKIVKKILTVGLIICPGAFIRPAAAPKIIANAYEIAFKNGSEEQRTAIIDKLVKRNKNDVQKTLFYALNNDYIWAIKPLMQRGANINIPNDEGKTVLHIAIQNMGFQ